MNISNNHNSNRKLIRTLKSATLFGNICKIEKFLGSGKAGEVYSGKLLVDYYPLKIGDKIAIKLYNKEILGKPNQIKRIEREANVSRSLNTTNLLKSFGMGYFNDRPFLIMEFLDGLTLSKYLKERGNNLNYSDKLEMAKRITAGLLELHNAGVIHRDLKPSNIFVTKNGKIKIMDFGVVSIHDVSTITDSNDFLGTIRYSSPEHLSGNKIDYRTDLFSLGLIFYELFLGKSLFSKEKIFSKQVTEVLNFSGFSYDLNIFNKPSEIIIYDLIRNLLNVDLQKRPGTKIVFDILKHGLGSKKWKFYNKLIEMGIHKAIESKNSAYKEAQLYFQEKIKGKKWPPNEIAEYIEEIDFLQNYSTDPDDTKICPVCGKDYFFPNYFYDYAGDCAVCKLTISKKTSRFLSIKSLMDNYNFSIKQWLLCYFLNELINHNNTSNPKKFLESESFQSKNFSKKIINKIKNIT